MSMGWVAAMGPPNPEKRISRHHARSKEGGLDTWIGGSDIGGGGGETGLDGPVRFLGRFWLAATQGPAEDGGLGDGVWGSSLGGCEHKELAHLAT